VNSEIKHSMQATNCQTFFWQCLTVLPLCYEEKPQILPWKNLRK